MNYTIELQPSGLTFDASEHTTILESALSANIHLEHSCKNGDCGVCGAQLLEGSAVDELGNKTESGKILTCRIKPKTNLKIIADYFPELSQIKTKITPSKVDEILSIARDIVVIKLRLPPNAGFNYLPGQYIDITYKGIKRSYSIANAQTASPGIELHIRRVPNGQMSGLLNEIKPDTMIRIEGPKGTFFIRDSDRPIIFLAGGTGFAPIKAMMEELMAKQSRRKQYLYWGMPSAESLYSDTPQKWADQHDHIAYTPVVSEDIENWPGRTGFVHHAVLEDFADLSEFTVYACGSPIMIDSAKKDFIKQGLPEKQFYSDAFTPAK